MKRLLFLLIIIIVYSGCKEKNSIKINGVIEGKKSGTIIINRLDLNTPVFIDSVKISKKGTFHLRVRSNEPDFYQVSLTPDNFITLLAEPGEKINLQFNSQILYDNYTVTGSAGSEKLRILDESLINTKKKLDSLSNAYTIASSNPGFDQRGPELETKFNELIKLQRKKNIEFIITNTTSLAAIKAVYQRIDPDTYVLYDPKDLQYLKILSDSLKKYYPNSKHVQALSRDFQSELTQMNANQLARLSEQLEPIKLNPDLKNPDGKRISLESLKGKYVLVTFWSVRSKDCINENTQLKEFYKMYNKKGFEIYQINIDADTSLWKSAVKYDELPWINTRENNPSDPATARLFNVRELPANYLFDKEGNIEATNLHGKTLKLKLEQLFNK
ncbi:MAG TPA: TlpA disulfide reductase family protein [Bacteroidales bacterium]|nr:TlpA disulfide reductase family protein [Bacteroidales bacterium]